MSPSRISQFLETLDQRILILDGAMGTMIQGFGLAEADYRGVDFADSEIPLKGCNDLLPLTRPDVIRRIHGDFFAAGADIIETNSFNANAISLADYGLAEQAYRLNAVAAKLAREVADELTAVDGKPRWVAGSMGPTTRTASLSPDVNDPAFRNVSFVQLAEAFAEQARGLLDGGVDLLLPETHIDTLNLKAALFGIEQVFAERGERVPVIASFTIPDASGRTLSGQTIEAVWNSIAGYDLLAVSINCALGAKEMRPHIQELARLAHCRICCFPNAGLPNEMGGYDDTPAAMAALLDEFAGEGWLNIVGGCCGTRPEHIAAIAQSVAPHAPRLAPQRDVLPRFSGMEPLVIRPDSNFILIGERTNITGSKRFARLIREQNYDAALSVARAQVEGGANLIDVNMDEGLIDSVAAMRTFLNLIAGEPDIAKLPIMVDSSRWEVLEAGLQCLQGKSIVNSISLKDGEAAFLDKARTIRLYGAAAVVMAFDEQGQATSLEDKARICRRAYQLLIEQAGFVPSDIIFDPNILTVATGIDEHNDYAQAFIEAVRRIKHECPGALISGGVSNVSFSFRGNDFVREAMHAAFLYHAIQAGLDMGIVNAGQLMVYEEIPPELLTAIEDVLFNRHADATEKLVELAGRYQRDARQEAEAAAWRSESLERRLAHALRQGVSDYLEADLGEALAKYSPLGIIEGPLMDGMNEIGDLFGAGKMFLPQVVKSARVMKQAVAFLQPLMSKDSAVAPSKGRVLMATVKGDVHDIGKNIVGVVLGCNHYEVIDLGVMVPAQRILAEARRLNVDVIGLSGLITPSLDEMVHVAQEMQHEGFALPLMIGGATTSRKHTAVRIAPAYSQPVAHVADASRAVGALKDLLAQGTDYADRLRAEQAHLREKFASEQAGKALLSLNEARARKPVYDWQSAEIPVPAFTGVRELELPLAELVEYIDWTPFFSTWELPGVYPRILDDARVGSAARELFEQAQKMLKQIVAEGWLQAKARFGFFPAHSLGDDIAVSYAGEETIFHTLRQQEPRKDGVQLALADWIAPAESGRQDYLGLFAVTAGLGIEPHLARFGAAHDDYSAILLKALADRLAEAAAEKLHQLARAEWGYGRDEQFAIRDLIKEQYRGIRPAPGYPACPDHSEKYPLFRLLDAEQIGVRLTEHGAMYPASSVSGQYFAHPDSRYFSLGKINAEQLTDYASRKGWTQAEAENWLRHWLV